MPLGNELRFRFCSFYLTGAVAQQLEVSAPSFLFWLVPLGNELRFRFRSFYLTGAVAQRVEVSAPFFFILARAVG